MLQEIETAKGPDRAPEGSGRGADGTAELVLLGLALIAPAAAFWGVALISYAAAAEVIFPAAVTLCTAGAFVILFALIARARGRSRTGA